MTGFLQAQVEDDELWEEALESETYWQREPHRDTCWPASGFAEGSTEEGAEASLVDMLVESTAAVIEVKDNHYQWSQVSSTGGSFPALAQALGMAATLAGCRAGWRSRESGRCESWS